MSWKIINEIMGLATLDDQFARKLLVEPLQAIQEHGFQLTDEEKKIFEHSQAQDIYELSQILLDRLPSY
ncbi:hypothetical protein [Tengunoibacter tsumagoiensis]|uniref:hypothetical protein n=1 Tax=Tengunoibacter tsumagoiensis TaxID=2014871 RepID=UPI000F830E34|nr:hypothetical protein [Tengunoibacter tsumagoiensis]